MYYLKSRYYDPGICRFINADSFASTGDGIVGCNMFAYCNDNPVNGVDPSGRSPWIILVTFIALLLSGCSKNTTSSAESARKSLRDAYSIYETTDDLFWDSSFNCYGNALKKAVYRDPYGYRKGDDVETVFSLVQADIGPENCMRLSSIDSQVPNGWYRVALRCAKNDYHFIREDQNGWFSKSGRLTGTYVDASYVAGDKWYIVAEGMDPDYNIIYSGPIIYFAINESWCES